MSATDAPFPFASVIHAIVTIDKIEIRPVGGSFETLISYPGGKDIDLANLQNGATAVLFEGNPKPGDYDAVRIIVHAKEMEIDDNGADKTFTDFKVPSGPQTGIKLYIDNQIHVVTSLTTDLVLDFDLAQSFVVQGNPATLAGIKGFLFKPVIRAINKSTAGSLTFRVMSDAGTPGDTSDDFYLNGATYTLTDTSDPSNPVVVATGSSGTNPNDSTQQGYVFRSAIPAGTYNLSVEATDHDTYTQTVTIVAANLSDLGTIKLMGTAGTVSGVVTTTLTTKDGETLTFAVVGATATAYPSGTTTVAGTDTTNTMGQYAVTSLAYGDYKIEITKAGYQTADQTGTTWVFGTANPPSVDFGLPPLTDDLTGTVRDGNGNLQVGATIDAVVTYGGVDKIIAETTTDVNGKYTFTALPTGSYTVKASTSGGLSGSATHDQVGGTGTATVDITVQ